MSWLLGIEWPLSLAPNCVALFQVISEMGAVAVWDLQDRPCGLRGGGSFWVLDALERSCQDRPGTFFVSETEAPLKQPKLKSQKLTSDVAEGRTLFFR